MNREEYEEYRKRKRETDERIIAEIRRNGNFITCDDEEEEDEDHAVADGMAIAVNMACIEEEKKLPSDNVLFWCHVASAIFTKEGK